RPGDAVVQRAPNALGKRRLIEDVRVVGIDRDLVRTANERPAEQRERAAGLPPDAPRHERMRRRAARRRATLCGLADAADAAGDPDEQIPVLVERKARHGALEEDV